MASEIQAAVSLTATKGGISLADALQVSFDMSGEDMGGPVSQVIGTSDEALAFPSDVGTGKLLLIVNLDTTNYVQISYGTGGGFSSFSKLDPNGGFYFGRPESLTIYAKANTATCRVKWSIVEA